MKTKTYGKKWLIGLFGLLFLFLILPIEKVRAESFVEVGEWKLDELDGNTIEKDKDYTWNDSTSTLTIKSAKALSLSKKVGALNDPSGKVIIAGVEHTEEGARISFDNISSNDLAIEVKDNSDVKLTFEGIDIKSPDAPALKIEDGSSVKIHLGGGKDNTLAKEEGDFPIIEKGASGTLTIGGGGTLGLNSQNNSGIGIGKKNEAVSNIEIFCKKLVCFGTKIAIGSGNGDVSNIRIKGEETDRTGGVTLACIRGNCLIGSQTGQTSGILISDSAIVSSSGQIKGERGNWNAMVFDDPNGAASGNADLKWRIYGDSFTLNEDLIVDVGQGEKFENESGTIKAGQTFTVKDGVTLTLKKDTGFVNKGNLVVNGHIQGSFETHNDQISGNGSITPKLPCGVQIVNSFNDKLYTGQGVSLVKNQDYEYRGDGAITDDTFKWYKDDNGNPVEPALGTAPKDVGIYHVKVSVNEGQFYAATAEATKQFEIKKADSQVLLSSSSNPAAVKKELSLTAIVTGVNNEHPTGKVDFEIKKGNAVVKEEKDVVVQSGKAVLKWTPEEKATYSVTAKYKPATDGTGKNYKESTSSEFSLTIDEKGSNPGGNSQGGSSATIIIPEAPKQENKKPEEKKEQDKKEKQKESKKETKSAFKDVKAKDKSYQAIKFAVDKGLLKEKNHKFHPSKKITAKDVVSVLYKLSGKAEDKKVSDKKELVKAEAFLKETKILSEKDGDFVKAKEITKEQLIQLLYNYAEYKGYNTKVTGKLDALKDSNKLSKSAVKPMKWALENGLITEKNNKLSPKSKVTRKELASILYNFLNKKETKKLNK